MALPPGATDCHFHIYDPQRAPGADVTTYLALQRRLGLSRGVLVQPSAYGFDNSLHLAALSTLGRDHFRLVAVVPTRRAAGSAGRTRCPSARHA